jgi:hypothetical protein
MDADFAAIRGSGQLRLPSTLKKAAVVIMGQVSDVHQLQYPEAGQKTSAN